MRHTAMRREAQTRIADGTDNLIDVTMRLWRQRMRRDISREDARQLIAHVTGFFDVLTEWEQASTAAANDNRAASSPKLK
jgi:hypothetical protein